MHKYQCKLSFLNFLTCANLHVDSKIHLKFNIERVKKKRTVENVLYNVDHVIVIYKLLVVLI